MNRRAFLKTGVGVSASALLGGLPRAARNAAAGTDSAKWRRFEVTTHAEIVDAAGVSRVWLPMPLMPDTDYHKSLGYTWSGNAAATRIYRDEKYGAGIFYAEWPAGEKNPSLDLVTRFATRDRAVNLSGAGSAPPEDKSVLAKYTKGTQFVRTDGIVLEKSREITKGLKTDVHKARAIYEWIVENTFRDPKTRGCGLGDIRAMLETGNLGGKCADLNALFVGLARAAGLPARDIYGVRVANSATYKSLGKSGEITKAQHCRAEFYLANYGWVPVDPADGARAALRRLGDELAGVQLRGGREAAELRRRAHRVLHVPAGRGCRRAARQPRPGQLPLQDGVPRADGLSGADAGRSLHGRLKR